MEGNEEWEGGGMGRVSRNRKKRGYDWSKEDRESKSQFLTFTDLETPTLFKFSKKTPQIPNKLLFAQDSQCQFYYLKSSEFWITSRIQKTEEGSTLFLPWDTAIVN